MWQRLWYTDAAGRASELWRRNDHLMIFEATLQKKEIKKKTKERKKEKRTDKDLRGVEPGGRTPFSGKPCTWERRKP